jgi:hypothetical protein
LAAQPALPARSNFFKPSGGRGSERSLDREGVIHRLSTRSSGRDTGRPIWGARHESGPDTIYLETGRTLSVLCTRTRRRFLSGRTASCGRLVIGPAGRRTKGLEDGLPTRLRLPSGLRVRLTQRGLAAA